LANQAHSGIRGVPWSRCQRCGQDTPTDKLVIQTGKSPAAGLRVCTLNGCFDDPFPNEYRDEIIKAALENSPDEMQVADILKSPPNSADEFIP
jgi:hypothetical protein